MHWSFIRRKNVGRSLIRFVTINLFDRWTDGQTDGRTDRWTDAHRKTAAAWWKLKLNSGLEHTDTNTHTNIIQDLQQWCQSWQCQRLWQQTVHLSVCVRTDELYCLDHCNTQHFNCDISDGAAPVFHPSSDRWEDGWNTGLLFVKFQTNYCFTICWSCQAHISKQWCDCIVLCK